MGPFFLTYEIGINVWETLKKILSINYWTDLNVTTRVICLTIRFTFGLNNNFHRGSTTFYFGQCYLNLILLQIDPKKFIAVILEATMFSLDLLNSHSQVRDQGPNGPHICY